MPTDRKVAIVRWLEEMLGRSTIVIATQYRGLSASEMAELRSRLKQQGLEYHVVKNTLLRLAAQNVGKDGLMAIIQGPTALAMGFGDPIEPARFLADYLRTSRGPLSLQGGMMDGRVLTAADVNTLALLPPRKVLLAQVLGQMQAPLATLLAVLKAPLQGLATLIKARMEQMEGGNHDHTSAEGSP